MDKTENWEKENLDHIASIPTPEIVKQGLRADFYFHEAIDALTEKEKSLTTIQEIEKLTKEVLKLCK